MEKSITLLITGRNNAGKTYFCKRFLEQCYAAHFNNDLIRNLTKNQDFSMEGRILAAKNMRKAVDESSAVVKLVDMIYPTKELREIISPDVIVYIKSDSASKYSDTDSLYQEPSPSEAKYFFSCYSRKTDQLVDRVLYWLQKSRH